MSPTKLRQLQERFGNIFSQMYASTENFAMALTLSKADHLFETPEDEKRLGSVGRVSPGADIKIVDDEGKQVKPGEIGELYLRSRGICMGYYKNLEKTAEEFVDGYWKSGDMSYKDEKGYHYLVDRKKDMIISGGFNVYAIQVESAVNSHPAVLMSAVIGIPNDEWGEQVHAEVMLKDGCSAKAEEIIEHVKNQMASYQTPKSVSFTDELPVNAVGKVQRRHVREKYWKNHERKI